MTFRKILKIFVFFGKTHVNAGRTNFNVGSNGGPYSCAESKVPIHMNIVIELGRPRVVFRFASARAPNPPDSGQARTCKL